MISDRWLLPEGVDEVLPPEADRFEQLRRQVLDLYGSWGYQLVIPPFIEYLESLLVGTGSDLDRQEKADGYMQLLREAFNPGTLDGLRPLANMFLRRLSRAVRVSC